MENEIFLAILANLAIHIPLYLVWLAGIILAAVTWKRNPRPSLFTLLAIVLLIILDLLSTYLSFLPLTLVNRRGLSVAQSAQIVTIVSVFLTLLRAGSWGLLLAAIFSGRKPAAVT